MATPPPLFSTEPGSSGSDCTERKRESKREKEKREKVKREERECQGEEDLSVFSMLDTFSLDHGDQERKRERERKKKKKEEREKGGERKEKGKEKG